VWHGWARDVSPALRSGLACDAEPGADLGPGVPIGEVLVVRRRLQDAAKVVKRTVEATTDEITSELQEALKS